MKLGDLQVVRPIPPGTSRLITIATRLLLLARLYAAVAVKTLLALIFLAGLVYAVKGVLGIAPEKLAVKTSDLLVVLGFTVVPLSLLAAAVSMGWLHRRSLRRAMNVGEDRVPTPHPLAPIPEAPRLSVTRASDVAEAPDETRQDALRIHANVQRAYVAAWLVYAAVVTASIIVYTSPTIRWDGRLAIAYAALAPQLLIVMWSLRLPYRWRFLVLFVYGVAGSILLPLMSNRAAHVVVTVIGPFSIFPMAGLLFLFSRRIQPFVVLLIASVVWFVGFGVVLDQFRPAVTIGTRQALDTNAWVVPLGVMNIILGVIITFFLLRARWPVRAVGIAFALTGTVLLDRGVRNQNLPLAVGIVYLLAVAVLQVFMLWSLFKLFVWVQERRVLTNELLHIHLCWAFLTLYYEGSTAAATLYTNRVAVRWGFVIALVLFVGTLHTLLFLIRRRCRRVAPKRLLLLRAFGRADEREDLLDDLNDTWRHVGAIDLIAATDVDSRTLQSTMLEAFLLRRSDEKFVRDKDEVEKRLAQRYFEIEGDARYPVNPVYCYASAWRSAFTDLTKGTNVFLMDLRGFSAQHKAVMWELTELLEHAELRRVVLIVDRRTDLDRLDAVLAGRQVTILDFDRRSKKERRALFDLLLNASA